MSKVWAFEGWGSHEEAEKALEGEEGVHDRLPERGKRGSEIPKDLFQWRACHGSKRAVGARQDDGRHCGATPVGPLRPLGQGDQAASQERPLQWW